MSKGKILVIDDEDQLRKAFSRIIELEGYEVFQSENASKGLRILEKDRDILLVIADVKLPDINGIQLLEKVRSKFTCEVILITAYGTIHDGVHAMKLGAFDYITKGDGDEQIVAIVEKAIEKAKLHRRILELEHKLETRYSFDRITGESSLIKETIRLAEKVALTDSIVLLEGETGTGKELFAQSIHNASIRRNKPFIAVNCSAFPKDLLESEMFGYKKGAFTGAVSDKKGLFEEANEGSLFLDEISEIHPEVQAKLLRVLEDQSFTKIGDTKPTRTDVRIIAATNRDLLKEAQNETFRSDLYYRISVFRIPVPPLRERKADIPLLVDSFVKDYSEKTNKKIVRISDDFMNKLTDYHWPGNTRELKNIIERAVILNDTNELTVDFLPSEIMHPADELKSMPEYGSLEEIERAHIQKMLSYTQGNKTRAAENLGIGIPTLYRKLKYYGLK
jgi:DNA-binding NtrC family response regulator